VPSPVAHALAGVTLHLALARDAQERYDLRRVALAVGAATAPDLDLLFRFVDGRNHHQGVTHSVGIALLAALVALVLARVTGNRPAAPWSVLVGLSWLSHVGLDLLNVDTHPPIGLMALWPFSHEYFKAPWPLFLDIGRTLEWKTVWHDAVAVAWELVVLLPLLYACSRLRPMARD
jgi:membrane-bound metal-dependent hydrolase YbcI (DUF457 family)